MTVAEAPKYPARIFSSAEVCVAAEVSYRKVDFWLSRGYIPAAEPEYEQRSEAEKEGHARIERSLQPDQHAVAP